MKKTLKIICIVLLVLFVIALIFTLIMCDLTKIREIPLEQASNIAKDRVENKITGDFYLFSINEYDNRLVITRYGAMDVISIKYIFDLENDVVKSAFIEEHFDSKLTAIMYDRDYINKKVNGNVVTGVLDAKDIIGMTREEVIQKFRDSYISIGMYEIDV